MFTTRAMSFGVVILATGIAMAASAEELQPAHRVYMNLLDPREHPDDARRHVKPPTWETFGNRTRCTSLRGFGVENDTIVKYVEEIDKYTKTFDLGDVLWPSYPIMFAKNLGDLAEEVKRRGLFLFDVWGYVPGSGPGGYWTQYRPPAEAFALLESTLGDRWLGMDVGEQDGRYIGGYASQVYPISRDRGEQYLNFQRHFERMGDELGNKLSTLVSLNFGHHFLKEGLYTLIGAETAQGLPNGQVYYAFIRGAGKQYGVPWFGNASIWNRWGYKSYGADEADHGPTKGTSLNLLKRLIYSHVLYNCVFVGFEAGWFDGDTLTPIGRIHQAAHRWIREHGQPGTMQTPIAIMADFLSGWTFPRHLYTSNVYRVWGNLPYEAGDYLTDGVIDMVYPGYQDASFYHNESGFIAPTPYGDSADCLLSDAEGWLLEQYPVLVLAGELAGGVELRDKLAAYVEGGGTLMITSGNLAKLPGGLAGIAVGDAARFDAGVTYQSGGTEIAEPYPFDVRRFTTLPQDARVLARAGDTPLVIEVSRGKGAIIAMASTFGVPAEPVVPVPSKSDIDAPLPKPFPLLNHVRAALDGVFRKTVLFEAGEGLSVIVCRKGAGEYTLGICNNGLLPKPFAIVSHCGPIESVSELPLDQSEKDATGYLPTGSEAADVGASNESVVAGGDVRLFAVKVREEGVAEIEHRVPPRRVPGRILPLRHARSIKEEVLLRPTFFAHFDGVAVDWRYVHERDRETLAREAGWIARQKLRVYVDLTSGINLYPDLRLVDNDPQPYAESMAAITDVLDKMETLGAHDAILSLHRTPENNFTPEQTRASFETTLREICKRAAGHSVTVYLRTSPKACASVQEAASLIEHVAEPNLKLAPSVALLLDRHADLVAVGAVKDRIGLWLAATPVYDDAGALWQTYGPVAGHADLAALMSVAPDAPVALDGVYANWDEEYLDVKSLEPARQAAQKEGGVEPPHSTENDK